MTFECHISTDQFSQSAIFVSMIALQTFFRYLMLFLFLFPQVQKSVHDIAHSSDFHCSASEKHFHQQEHNCELCDYNVLVFTNGIDKPDEIITGDFSTDVIITFPVAAFEIYLQQTGSRAPPVCKELLV